MATPPAAVAVVLATVLTVLPTAFVADDKIPVAPFTAITVVKAIIEAAANIPVKVASLGSISVPSPNKVSGAEYLTAK